MLITIDEGCRRVAFDFCRVQYMEIYDGESVVHFWLDGKPDSIAIKLRSHERALTIIDDIEIAWISGVRSRSFCIE